MKEYAKDINSLLSKQKKIFSEAMCSYIYSKLFIQVGELMVDFKNGHYIQYNRDWKEVKIKPIIIDGKLKRVEIQSDYIPELKLPLVIDEVTKVNDAFTELLLSINITNTVFNPPTLECLIGAECSHTVSDITNEVIVHETIASVVDRANNSSAMSDEWFKGRQISEDIKTVNSCLLIRPNWDNGYTAHVLPLSWFFKLNVPEIKITRVRPKLLQAWYEVETGFSESVLNIIDHGE